MDPLVALATGQREMRGGSAGDSATEHIRTKDALISREKALFLSLRSELLHFFVASTMGLTRDVMRTERESRPLLALGNRALLQFPSSRDYDGSVLLYGTVQL